MKEKKHIDRLFKERFENFEPAPSPRVWDNIEKQLHPRKRERTLVPLWWKVAGVAALIALLLTVGNALFTEQPHDAEIVTEDKAMPASETDPKRVSPPTETNPEQTPVAAQETMEDTHGDQPKGSLTGTEGNNTVRTYVKLPNNQNRSDIAAEGTSEGKKSRDKKATFQNSVDARIKSPDGNEVGERQKEAVAVQPVDRPSEEKEVSPIVRPEPAIAESNTNRYDRNTTDKTAEKPSLIEEVAKQEAEKAPALAQAPAQRWSVAPTVGPVYYSSFGNGSSLDPSFADNAQNGDVNFSYGVQVSYDISERLSVRSGISNVDLSYSTGGIEVGTGPVSAALKTVDYGGKNVVVSAFDAGALDGAATEGNPFMNITPKATGGNALLVQNISYFEVPVELKYAVVKSKLGVNLIGGMSTLFLGDNEISIESNNFNTVLGEANNLNEISFTTNVGLGVDYKISKNLLFNIEPIFKYQLNPYTDASVDFRPYYFGVYSGLNFKF